MRKNKSVFMGGVEERKEKIIIIFLFQTKIKVLLKKNKNTPLGPPELPSPKVSPLIILQLFVRPLAASHLEKLADISTSLPTLINARMRSLDICVITLSC